jgi:hypothetical protein
MRAAADLTDDHASEARSRLAAPNALTDHATRALAIGEAQVCALLAVADAIDALTQVVVDLINDVQGPEPTKG